MQFYQIGVIVLVGAALSGVYFIRTRGFKTVITAATSGVLVLLCGIFYRLILQQEILWDAVQIDLDGGRASTTLIDYIRMVHGNISGYTQAMEMTFWLLLIFVLAAPFIGWLRRGKQTQLSS